jgi:hypothetical protein
MLAGLVLHQGEQLGSSLPFDAPGCPRRPPRSRPFGLDGLLEPVPLLHDELEHLPAVHVPRPGERDDAETKGVPQFALPCLPSNVLVSTQNDKPATSHDGDPVGILCPEGDLQEIPMARMDDVVASCHECVAQPDDVLVNEEPMCLDHSRRASALEVDGLRDEGRRELVDRSDSSNRVAGTHELGEDVGADTVDRRRPERSQRVQEHTRCVPDRECGGLLILPSHPTVERVGPFGEDGLTCARRIWPDPVWWSTRYESAGWGC